MRLEYLWIVFSLVAHISHGRGSFIEKDALSPR